MAGSTEGRAGGGHQLQSIAGPDWRARAALVQQAAMPSGRVLLTCSAPLGGGGLGRHMQEILDALDRNGQPCDYLCEARRGAAPADPERELQVRRIAALRPLTRLSPSWRLWAASYAFDRAAARRLPATEHLIAFNGTAVRQFRLARRTGVSSLALVSATAHMRLVVAQHRRAHRQYPIERPWSARLLRRNLAEYAQADRIYVSSQYVRHSFLDAGVPEETLVHFPLTPAPRFRASGIEAPSSTFDVVYVGGLTVDKGVPLLLDAFARLDHEDIRLVLVGGWKTRGMRRRVQEACARDARISVSPGDPLARLQRASLYVHPTYTDGFGYAPAEAMACGVPVLVTADTGMQDLVEDGHNGQVLPTGDLGALADAIDAAYRGELFAA